MFYSTSTLQAFNKQCLDFLYQQLVLQDCSTIQISFDNLKPEKTEQHFGIKPFFVELGNFNKTDSVQFSFTAPTTAFNTLRLLRGMQLKKAILLEGSPGVGKTSLVMMLAKCTNNKILRINLSDQTVSFFGVLYYIFIKGSKTGVF